MQKASIHKDQRRQLFVENFPNSWTEKDLARFFQTKDSLLGVRLHKSKTTGKPFAILLMSDHEAAETMINDLHGTWFTGMKLRVKYHQ